MHPVGDMMRPTHPRACTYRILTLISLLTLLTGYVTVTVTRTHDDTRITPTHLDSIASHDIRHELTWDDQHATPTWIQYGTHRYALVAPITLPSTPLTQSAPRQSKPHAPLLSSHPLTLLDTSVSHPAVLLDTSHVTSHAGATHSESEHILTPFTPRWYLYLAIAFACVVTAAIGSGLAMGLLSINPFDLAVVSMQCGMACHVMACQARRGDGMECDDNSCM